MSAGRAGNPVPFGSCGVRGPNLAHALPMTAAAGAVSVAAVVPVPLTKAAVIGPARTTTEMRRDHD
ncbi:hypothetical protein [Nonomuraea sp. NPDC001699]